MSNAWDGPNPVGQDDGATYYELGVAFTAVADITITGVRVWHPASSMSVVGRQARIWTTGGSVLESANLDDSLASGWTTYDLDAPLEVQAGASLVLSYSTLRYYGAVSGSFPNPSADAAVDLTAGRFTESNLFPFPTTVTGTFYGIDLEYTIGIGGNVAPTVTVSATATGRTVTAVAVATDEAPGSLTYRWEWGDGNVTAAGAATEQHTYATDGLYAVLVIVTDVGGLRDSAAAPVVAALGLPGAMSLAAVMGELADRLDTVPLLNVYQGWPSKIVPPAAIVVYPTRVEFDQTYHGATHRGPDKYELPVVVVVSRMPDEKALPDLDGYASGSGARSVKAVLESGVYTTFEATTLHVGDADFDVYRFAGVDYLAVVFGVSLMG